jgi:hypothetical protein
MAIATIHTSNLYAVSTFGNFSKTTDAGATWNSLAVH